MWMYLWSSLKRVPMVWQTSQPPAVASSTLSQELMARMRPNAGALRFPTLTLVFYFVSPGTFFIFLRLSITCQLWGSELKLWLHFMLPLIIVVANIVTAEKKTTWKMALFEQFCEEAPDSWTTKQDWRRRKTISNYLCSNSYVTCQ